MLCPHDKSTLQAHGEGATATPVFFCENCHGLWFGREQLAHFLRNENSVKILLKQKIVSGKIQRSASQCFCPSCEKMELAAKVIDGVEIDFCKRCQGIWLDAGELDLIITRYRRKQKLSAVSDGASEFLDGAVSNSDLLLELGNVMSDALSQSAEWASEAAPALLDFLGDAFSAIDF
jgi:Zn-finger nucleic acid-binding protein